MTRRESPRLQAAEQSSKAARSGRPTESDERMEVFLDALSARFDPEFAKRAARQLSLAAEIVEASQGISPSAYLDLHRAGRVDWNQEEPSFGGQWIPEEIEIAQHRPFEAVPDPPPLVAIEDIASPKQVAESAGQSVQKIGIVLTLAIVFGSTSLILISATVGLAGMYFGLTAFFASQFAAHQADEEPLIVPPDLAAVGFVGAMGLVVTAILASL
jgi:hypothetical protein